MHRRRLPNQEQPFTVANYGRMTGKPECMVRRFVASEK
jgi:hypothetical protein